MLKREIYTKSFSVLDYAIRELCVFYFTIFSTTLDTNNF